MGMTWRYQYAGQRNWAYLLHGFRRDLTRMGIKPGNVPPDLLERGEDIRWPLKPVRRPRFTTKPPCPLCGEVHDPFTPGIMNRYRD